MATQLLAGSVQTGSTFRYVVHLDTTKTITDPKDATKTIPDPAYVLDRSFGDKPQQPGETAAAYTARLAAFDTKARAEMKLLCTDALARLNPTATALTGVGSAF